MDGYSVLLETRSDAWNFTTCLFTLNYALINTTWILTVSPLALNYTCTFNFNFVPHPPFQRVLPFSWLQYG